MRTCLLAALALAISATGCTTLKPSHREYKTTKATAAERSEPSQIQQVQYVEPAGAYPAQAAQAYAAQAYAAQPYPAQGYPAPGMQQPAQPAGQYGPGIAAGGCPDGNCPGYGGGRGHFAHGGPRGYHKLFDGGRYGYFNGAHHTPGYPHHHFSREYVGPQGPPTAQVAYPYYTIRGPRDFLLDNPPSIGR